MSLQVVYREPSTFARSLEWASLNLHGLAHVCDYTVTPPDARDGEWPAVLTLPAETVEVEGMAVPAFDGDAERLAWAWSRAYRRPRWRMRHGVAL